MIEPGSEFLDLSRSFLTRDYLPKIKLAVEPLTTADVWWRPHRGATSIGNLVLHLAGNIRQWIIAGLGSEPDRRRRDEEFETRSGESAALLLDRLSAAVAAADRVLASLDPETLGDIRFIQGRKVTAIGAVYHVVEHFAMHTGQIVWIAKMRTGRDLAFYVKDSDGVVRAAWPGAEPEA